MVPAVLFKTAGTFLSPTSLVGLARFPKLLLEVLPNVLPFVYYETILYAFELVPSPVNVISELRYAAGRGA